MVDWSKPIKLENDTRKVRLLGTIRGENSHVIVYEHYEDGPENVMLFRADGSSCTGHRVVNKPEETHLYVNIMPGPYTHSYRCISAADVAGGGQRMGLIKVTVVDNKVTVVEVLG
jgi:hypothetical protein